LEEKHKKQIEEIMASMECPSSFERCKWPFDKLCKARDSGLEGYVDCLEEKTTLCEFKVPFGSGVFCRCPLRVYITKTLRK